VIVRVMGEGQFELDADTIVDLNEIDRVVEHAVEQGDVDGLRVALHRLVAEVKEVGQRLPDEIIRPSDLILPPVDATVHEVRDMLSEEGLLPG
jgi:hypothetical protein